MPLRLIIYGLVAFFKRIEGQIIKQLLYVEINQNIKFLYYI